MKKQIILINGIAGSGKSSLAAYIQEKLENINKMCLIAHNADSVKHLAKDYFGWDGIKDFKGRQLLINLSNLGYEYDEFFWEKKNIINEIDRTICVIPDFRYHKTFEYFKKEGNEIITVHITRPNFENGLDEKLKNDKSEQGFEGFDFDFEVINNTLDDLRYASKKIVERILEK